jgi:hypothetical protein
MSDNPVTLDFLARQQAKILDEVASLRDDMGVLTATINRVNASLTTLLIQSRYLASRTPT